MYPDQGTLNLDPDPGIPICIQYKMLKIFVSVQVQNQKKSAKNYKIDTLICALKIPTKSSFFANFL